MPAKERLDSQVQLVLEKLNAARAVPAEQCEPRELRRRAWGWTEFTGVPEPVASIANRFVSGPSADIPVRVYAPSGEGPLPALVYFHGGGWVVNNLDIVDAPCRMLANRTRCVVISVGYQKAPEHKFPTALHDAYAAFAWVSENARSLNVDPALIGVAGDSAGGNLAIGTCLLGRAQGAVVPAFQLLLYPALDPTLASASMQRFSEGYMLTASALRHYWDLYLRDRRDWSNPLAAPLGALDPEKFPPTVLITAELDPLRDEGHAFGERLACAGVQIVARQYDGMIHGFMWMAGRVDMTKQMFNDVGVDMNQIINRLRTGSWRPARTW
uniref:Alpha/beta hydrolase n=1 Tax=Bosea sp. NBC_00436 TaxID=2969620 RepID=A0A9E7ZTM5_9HYPH